MVKHAQMYPSEDGDILRPKDGTEFLRIRPFFLFRLKVAMARGPLDRSW
jgi:hypothetical protein